MSELNQIEQQLNQNIVTLDRRVNELAASSVTATSNLSLSVNELYRENNVLKTQIAEMRQGFMQLRGVIQQMLAPKQQSISKAVTPTEEPSVKEEVKQDADTQK